MPFDGGGLLDSKQLGDPIPMDEMTQLWSTDSTDFSSTKEAIAPFSQVGFAEDVCPASPAICVAEPYVRSELQATGAVEGPLDDAAMDPDGNRSEADLIASPQPVDDADKAPADEEARSDQATDTAFGSQRGVEHSGEVTEGANSRDPAAATSPHIQMFCEVFNREYWLAPEGVSAMAYVLRDDVISVMLDLLASGQSIAMFRDKGLGAQQRFLVNTGGDLCLKPADSHAKPLQEAVAEAVSQWTGSFLADVVPTLKSMGLPLRKYFGSSKYTHTWNTLLKKITKPKDGCWYAIKEGRASAALRFRQTSRGVLVLKSLIPCILAWHDYVKTDEAKSRAIELALPSFRSVSAPAVAPVNKAAAESAAKTAAAPPQKAVVVTRPDAAAAPASATRTAAAAAYSDGLHRVGDGVLALDPHLLGDRSCYRPAVVSAVYHHQSTTPQYGVKFLRDHLFVIDHLYSDLVEKFNQIKQHGNPHVFVDKFGTTLGGEGGANLEVQVSCSDITKLPRSEWQEARKLRGRRSGPGAPPGPGLFACQADAGVP